MESSVPNINLYGGLVCQPYNFICCVCLGDAQPSPSFPSQALVVLRLVLYGR